MTDLRRQGDNEPPPLEAIAADDPDLWLVTADPVAWSEAHDCTCDAGCECEDA